MADSTPCWQLTEHAAQLQLDSLHASLDLCRPQRGLTNLCFAERTLAAAVLGLSIPNDTQMDRIAPHDNYVRGADLVAAYEESPSRSFRTLVYWRALNRPHKIEAVGVELLVSVQTSLLDTQPEPIVESRLAAGEVLRLRDANQRVFDPLDTSSCDPLECRPREGPMCLVCRFDGAEVSYVEMVHPADFQLSTLTCDRSAEIAFSHRLFGRHLEKGVLIRSRVASLLVDRKRDTQLAAQLYEHFVRSKLPLTV